MGLFLGCLSVRLSVCLAVRRLKIDKLWFPVDNLPKYYSISFKLDTLIGLRSNLAGIVFGLSVCPSVCLAVCRLKIDMLWFPADNSPKY